MGEGGGFDTDDGGMLATTLASANTRVECEGVGQGGEDGGKVKWLGRRVDWASEADGWVMGDLEVQVAGQI